jgi:hypothetical protein
LNWSHRPEFDELLDGGESPEERERLRRVHDLLVATDPPPELSSTLLKPPPPRGHVLFPKRRLSPRLVLVGAAVFGAFLVGFLAGSPDSDREGPAAGIDIARTVQLEGEGDANGAVGVGFRDEKGNLPMVLSVWGLRHLTDGDYYTLALTRKGGRTVNCGTFNVSGDQTTVRMIAAYDLKRFEGWAVMLWDAQTRDETRVLWSDEI